MVSWQSAPLKATTHDEPTFALAWPSGQGDEIGVVQASIDEAWTSIRRNAKGLDRPFRVTEVEESGAIALMVEGLGASPVTLVHEPEGGDDFLAIVADRGADLDAVRGALTLLLPSLPVTFHGEAS